MNGVRRRRRSYYYRYTCSSDCYKTYFQEEYDVESNEEELKLSDTKLNDLNDNEQNTI